MRAPLLALLLLLPLLALPASGSAEGFTATAAGTASFTVRSADTDAPLCDGSAAYALEAAGSGALAWASEACPGDWATGVVPFTLRCTDACWTDCWTWDDTVWCEGRVEAPLRPGGTVSVTLARDGAFTFEAWVGGAHVTGTGSLLVLTWPSS